MQLKWLVEVTTALSGLSQRSMRARFYERFGFREVKHSTVKRNLVEVPIVVMEMPANPTLERDARKSGVRPSL